MRLFYQSRVRHLEMDNSGLQNSLVIKDHEVFYPRLQPRDGNNEWACSLWHRISPATCMGVSNLCFLQLIINRCIISYLQIHCHQKKAALLVTRPACATGMVHSRLTNLGVKPGILECEPIGGARRRSPRKAQLRAESCQRARGTECGVD